MTPQFWKIQPLKSLQLRNMKIGRPVFLETHKKSLKKPSRKRHKNFDVLVETCHSVSYWPFSRQTRPHDFVLLMQIFFLNVLHAKKLNKISVIPECHIFVKVKVCISQQTKLLQRQRPVHNFHDHYCLFITDIFLSLKCY